MDESLNKLTTMSHFGDKLLDKDASKYVTQNLLKITALVSNYTIKRN